MEDPLNLPISWVLSAFQSQEGNVGGPAPLQARGPPAWHCCIMSPRDICAHHRGAVSMPIPVGGKSGKEAVGAVETWAPDNSRAATEIASLVP